MRVLHVVPELSATYGGPAYAVDAMTRAMASQGCHVEIVSTRPFGADGFSGLRNDQTARVLRFPRQRLAHWSFSWPLTDWLLSHISNYQILHVHALFNYPTFISCIAARRQGIPYIIRPAGTLDPWALKYRGWKKAPYYRLIERRNITGAAAIHATTLQEKADIQALGVSDRVVMIPLGIDVPNAIRRSEDRPGSESLKVLYLSRLHPKKGVDLLIESVGRIESPIRFQLIVAGAGEPRFVNKLRASVRERGLSNRVQFVGWVSGPTKRELLEQADIFVLPSHSENFGVAVGEAMAASIPVIVSDRVGLAGAVEQSGAGLVVPIDVTSIASALSKLVEDPEMRQRMGAAGRAYVTSELSWPHIATQLILLYEQVLDCRR